MADPSAKILACPNCATLNRVPAAKLTAGGKCGRCGEPLFRGAPVVLTPANFEAHAAKSDLPLLVDFWAAWCGPCQKMAPAFAAAAGQLEPQFRLGKLDTEAEEAIAGRYGIRSIPTLVVIAKGGRSPGRRGRCPRRRSSPGRGRRSAGAGRDKVGGLSKGQGGGEPVDGDCHGPFEAEPVPSAIETCRA